MAKNSIDRVTVTPDCEICKNEPARVRVIVADPLVESESTYVGANCYAVNAGAVAILLASDIRLIVTEVAA